MWGLKSALSKYGMTLTVIENAEVYGNLTGGVRQGFEVNGLTTATLQLDTQRAFGLNGGLFNVSGLQNWGGDLNVTNLHSFWAGTGIESEAAVRLWELWYQQKFSDKFDIKIGEQSLDQEFIVSQDASYLLYAVNGWPLLFSDREFARRRPRLSACGLGRPRARSGDGQCHGDRRPLQRQPDPKEIRPTRRRAIPMA